MDDPQLPKIPDSRSLVALACTRITTSGRKYPQLARWRRPGPSFARTSARSAFISSRASAETSNWRTSALDGVGREIVLDQFGHHAASGDQIHHGDKGRADHAAQDGGGDGRNAINHDHGCAEQRRFDGGRSAGHDGAVGGGKGVISGAFDALDSKAGAGVRREKFGGQVGRGRVYELDRRPGLFRGARKQLARFEDSRIILRDFVSPASGQERDDRPCRRRARARRQIPRGSWSGAPRPPAGARRNPPARRHRDRFSPQRERSRPCDSPDVSRRARARPPRPDLRADEIADGNSGVFQPPRDAQMRARRIDQDRERRAALRRLRARAGSAR